MKVAVLAENNLALPMGDFSFYLKVDNRGLIFMGKTLPKVLFVCKKNIAPLFPFKAPLCAADGIIESFSCIKGEPVVNFE